MTGGDPRRGRTDRGGSEPGGPPGGDRGVSEFTGVAILVGITLLVTGSVGLYVLVDSGSGNPGPNANFTFQYLDSASVLVVTHDRGDNFTASNLTLRSSERSVPWHELANAPENSSVTPGSTVQLSRRNAYGEPVGSGDRIAVVHAPPAGNETVLDRWNGTG
ncbi:type IV pilin N-terminal domain-containing protein [Halosimplex marinum]|uniref:type IV pilin N-terminal domain-containing protein n=1 Tax=Halosimplex marinum TaxID=3396620 RepID=UPI003F5449B7